MKNFYLILLSLLFLTKTYAINYNDWLTAYHETIICVDENGLQPGMTTYPMKPDKFLRQQILGKANFTLKRGEKTYKFNKAKNAGLIRTIYGFKLTGTVQNVKYVVDCAPMIISRDSNVREGGMIIKLSLEGGCKPNDKIIINYGGLARGEWVLPHTRYKLLEVDGFPSAANNIITEKKDYTIISSPDLTASVGITAEANSRRIPFSKNEKLNTARAVWHLDNSSHQELFINVAFAKNKKELPKVLSKNPEKQLKISQDYFEKISKIAVVKTPVKNIDEAFKWGILCLEYCYYKPFGWIESLDHWLTLYSMMYPRVADDINQTERSKLCLLEHAKNIDKSGRIRNLCPSGLVRIDFMWNHHFLWDVEHYLDKTGDIETIREIYDPVKKVYENTFKTYDKDGNLLIGYDQQIGYQEDFVNTPNDGGSASMAGIEMLRIMSKLANAIGNEDEAKLFAEKERIARARLKKEIWSTDLGRYIYYKDHYGVIHWDGQYHTFSWPSIYNFSDDFGKYTSLRHLTDTLISPRGLVYVSKNFPKHIPHTTGCQEAAAQTPIAAMGLSMGGMRNAGAKMFAAFANMIMSPKNQGCFPETAPERGTWFSSTASFYLEGIIEGLFGLRWRNEGKLLVINPGIPNSWSNASIKLPEVSAEFNQTKKSRQLILKTKNKLPVEINWTLPLAAKYSVIINGRKVNPEITPAINGVKIKLKLVARKNYNIQIDFKPVNAKIKYPKNIQEGSEFNCKIKNANIVGIEDPARLLTSISYRKNNADLRLSSGLMDKYLNFGPMGVKIFSRRTFFLKLQAGKHQTFYPVNFTVKPVIIPEQKPDKSFKGTFITIPFERNQQSTNWQSFRMFDTIKALGLQNIKDPLADLVSKSKKIGGSNVVKFIAKEAGKIPFEIEPGKLLVLSDRLDSPSSTFRVDKKARKIYFLLEAFVNNKDVFSEVGNIIVRCAKPKGEHAVAPPEPHLIKKNLYYPGNVDNWMPVVKSCGYSSYGLGWSSSPAISTSDSVFSIIEIDLDKEEFVKSITINVNGRMPAIAVVAITAEK